MQILKVHAGKVSLFEDVDPELAAAPTPGSTSADPAHQVNKTALAATRRGGTDVKMPDFNAGVERIIAGFERIERVLTPRDLEIVAYRAMGHDIVASAIQGSDPVHHTSIITRGIGALDCAFHRPTEDRFLMTRQKLENRMGVLTRGRAAEHGLHRLLATGAAGDPSKIADIARSTVARHGMEIDLGHVAFDVEQRSYLGPLGEPLRKCDYSEDTARDTDRAVRRAVATAFARAEEILRSYRQLVDESARLLLEKETLAGQELTEPFWAIVPAEPDHQPVVPDCVCGGES